MAVSFSGPWKSMTLLSLIVLPSILTLLPAYGGLQARLSTFFETVYHQSTHGLKSSFPRDPPSSMLVSIDPLVIYIKDFVTKAEAAHIVEISEPHFAKSGVSSSDLKKQTRNDIRDSYSAMPNRDAVVRGVEDRARRFQGPTISGPLESMKVVRYFREGKFSYHTDWFNEEAAKIRRRNRQSSFFVYLEANCTGGGTHFPHLTLTDDKGIWCEFIDCEQDQDLGVTFKPIQGNAIFWQNLNRDGSGRDDVLHAGMPVIEGVKTGMNIWTLTPKDTDKIDL